MSDGVSEFRDYCTHYFARLCRGYSQALDGSGVRAWVSGHKNLNDMDGAWDMSSRMFPALAAWLSDPTRPRTLEVRGTSVDVESLAVTILENAFDPDRPGFWGRDAHGRADQRTVESSVIAYGAWLLRDGLMTSISDRARDCLEEWLTYFGSAPLVTNNWNLFWIVNHTARKAIGWSYDQAVIDEAWGKIDALERGDGWMADGGEHSFDDYNWWVFGSHEMFWMQMDGASDPVRVQAISARVSRRLEEYPYFFGADGSYTEYGRSLAYKFARLVAPVLGYKLGLWPHTPGMLKCLVKRHLRYYDYLGAVDRETDVVRQGLSEFGVADVRDRYIGTGHSYWCMLAFAALWQLGEDDEIWSIDEDPLPVERADFTRTIRPAGWVLTGDREGGQVQRHVLGTMHGGGYGAKYGKFMYGSHFPVNLAPVEGDFGPDSSICLTDGVSWGHPGELQGFAAGEGWLRGRYGIAVGDSVVECETILVPRGQACLRVHRLAASVDLKVVEGGAPLGYGPGSVPGKRTYPEVPVSLCFDDAATSSIRGVIGYETARPAAGFRGREDLNGVHARAITPTLETSLVTGVPLMLVCYCEAKRIPDAEPPNIETDVEWSENGAVTVKFDATTLEIPPL